MAENGSATTFHFEPYTLQDLAAQVEPQTDEAPGPKAGIEDVFGDDKPAVLRAFQQRTGLSPEDTAYVFMGIIFGVLMAEARRADR